MDLLREFWSATITTAGGIVEPTPDGIAGLLPAAAAEGLGLPEECHITMDASEESAASTAGIDGRLGSPMLERIVRQRLAAAPLTCVALAAELPRPLPDNIPVLLNAVRAGSEETTRASLRYLVAEARVVLQADEVRSAIDSVCVRLDDGAIVRRLPLERAYPLQLEPLESAAVRRVHAALVRWLHRRGPVLLQQTLETIARRARRDLERMAEFYASLDAEMAQAITRARSEEERARRRAKRAGLAGDMAARRAQLCERLTPRLSASLIAATLVATEAVCFAVAVRRRSQTGSVLVRYRAADGSFEGPACDACGTATLRLFLCDERLHVLCEQCGQHGRLDPSRCRACRRQPPEAPVLSIDDPTTVLQLGR